MEASNLVRDTIYQATMLLDDQKWDEWLDLCDDKFEYSVKAFSPEINYDMTYWLLDRDELQKMFTLLPKHNTDHSPLRRHTSVYSVKMSEDGKTATAISSVAVYQNLLDSTNSHIDAGESRLFLVGKYLDTIKVENGKATFLNREVRLDNRRVDKGTHWPI